MAELTQVQDITHKINMILVPAKGDNDVVGGADDDDDNDYH